MGMHAVDETNPWIQDVLTAKWRWPTGLASLSAAGFAVALLALFRQIGPPLQMGIASAAGALPAPWADIVAAGALQGLVFGGFLIAALAAMRLEGRPLWRRSDAAIRDVTVGLAFGTGGYFAATGLAFALGCVGPGPNPPFSIGVSAVAFGLALVAVQSLAEEAFFRGWLQPVICARIGALPGLALTTALFAALHIIAGLQPSAPPQLTLAIVNMFLGGLLFGLLALKTGSLLAPALAHLAWNWTESGVVGLDEGPTGSLLGLKLSGPALWSGGPQLMNGSLAATLVLLTLVTATALLGRSKAH